MAPTRPSIAEKVALATLLLLAIMLWIVCILLLIAVTTTLLDTLRYIVDLAQMS
jgi:hypothetical protein